MLQEVRCFQVHHVHAHDARGNTIECMMAILYMYCWQTSTSVILGGLPVNKLGGSVILPACTCAQTFKLAVCNY